jgi:hypothetical protein
VINTVSDFRLISSKDSLHLQRLDASAAAR